MKVTIVVIRTVGVYQTYLCIVQRRFEYVAVGAGIFNTVAGQIQSLVAVRPREEYCQIESFVRECITDTVSELWFRVSDVGTVFVVDDPVTVAVLIDIVAYPRTVLGNCITFGYGYLLHVAIGIFVVEIRRFIETSDNFVAPELSDRLSYGRFGYDVACGTGLITLFNGRIVRIEFQYFVTVE